MALRDCKYNNDCGHCDGCKLSQSERDVVYGFYVLIITCWVWFLLSLAIAFGWIE